MKTIMAIGAHVGDMELTCGAYLATEYLKGNKIIARAIDTSTALANVKAIFNALNQMY